MGMFDQAARQACKLDGGGLTGWLARRAGGPAGFGFDRFDDTRRTSWPGGPERTDDVVAVLAHERDAARQAYLIVEAETEPKADALARLGVYELLLAIEVRAVAPGGPAVYGAVIRLTGERANGPLALTGSASEPGVLVAPLDIALAEEGAADTLDRIDGGEVAGCVLAWVPLMAGGGEPATIERWKRLVEREADRERRASLRYFALVFAELTPELVNWQRGLEGWEMQESKYINSILERGEQAGRLRQSRADILRMLRNRLGDSVPEPIRLAVEGTNAIETLERWFDAALAAGSWADFQAAMKQG